MERIVEKNQRYNCITTKHEGGEREKERERERESISNAHNYINKETNGENCG